MEKAIENEIYISPYHIGEHFSLDKAVRHYSELFEWKTIRVVSKSTVTKKDLLDYTKPFTIINIIVPEKFQSRQTIFGFSKEIDTVIHKKINKIRPQTYYAMPFTHILCNPL